LEEAEDGERREGGARERDDDEEQEAQVAIAVDVGGVGLLTTKRMMPWAMRRLVASFSSRGSVMKCWRSRNVPKAVAMNGIVSA